jgi:RimJ/RimL family protein N-acetyltransferase
MESHQLPIETERLLLRSFEEGDLDVLAALHSDAELVRWIPWGPRDRDEVREVLERKVAATDFASTPNGLGIAVCVRESGALIGDFVLTNASPADRTAEIGFMLLAEHQGSGYALEACRAILELGFGKLGLHRVFARLEARNAASAAVCERLGMRREAHLVESEWVKGEWQSELIYALLEREWRTAREAGGG